MTMGLEIYNLRMIELIMPLLECVCFIFVFVFVVVVDIVCENCLTVPLLNEGNLLACTVTVKQQNGDKVETQAIQRDHIF